jgi:hypothetical protein
MGEWMGLYRLAMFPFSVKDHMLCYFKTRFPVQAQDAINADIGLKNILR